MMRKNNLLQRFKKILFYSLGIFLAWQFSLKKTDGFALQKIQSSLPFHKEWATKSFSFDSSILNQPYFYLTKGAQTFVFVSKDQKYVLKFYRHHRSTHPLGFLSPVLPLTWKNSLFKTLQKRSNKRCKDFSSYHLAFQNLSQETGLIDVHLNKTTGEKKIVTLYDKIGCVHQVDLHKMTFILQKKAKLVYPSLENWIADQDFEKGEKALSRLIELLQTRCQKQIFDKDPDLETNFGFIGEVPLQIDIGRFKRDPSRSDPKVYRDELIRITDQLCKWLDKKAPRLSAFVKKELNEKN